MHSQERVPVLRLGITNHLVRRQTNGTDEHLI
jgi:hypothetical protein